MYTRNTVTLLSVFSVALAQDTSVPLALEVLPAASLNLLPDMGTGMPMLPSASATSTPIPPISMAESMTPSNSMPTTDMSSMPTASVTMPMDPSVTAMNSMTTSMMMGTGGGGGGGMPSMSAGGNMSMTLPTLKGSSTASGSAKASGTGPSVASNGGEEVGSSIKTVMVVLAGVAGLFVLA